MDSPSNWENAAKSSAWVCKKCGKENKALTRECASCGHEPVLGSMQHELRRWSDSHRGDEDGGG